MNERTKATVIGGLLAGIPSALPVISICCFLWALAGGALSVFLHTKNDATPMTPGDGAKLGLRAGVVGAIAYLVIAVPIMLITGAASIAQGLQRAGGETAGMAGMAAGLGFFFVFVAAAIIVGLTALGGLIGAAIFGKGRPGGMGTPPPPPPSDFGGGGYTPPPPAGGSSGTYGSGS
ncbi:MAG: hypothetical protein LC785_15555 [Acidobacteria bacterium]|nr:hypothetical protein [Acidobacteriota bacterium]MCA1643322.1 hypothetical protein [Acidobacteriota bacterium]